jgi:NADH-quinone oxidoreductase subunit N
MSFLDLIILLPELFFINFLLIFLWVGLYLRYKFLNTVFANALNCYSAFLLTLLIMLLLNTNVVNSNILLGVFHFTYFENFLKIFTLFASALVILSINDNEKHLSVGSVDVEVNMIRLTIIASMLLLISVNDIVYLFFILELYALAAYVLVGYRGKNSVFSGEAALKYFLLGTVFSIIMCYSFAIIYLSTGLTNFTSLEVYLSLSASSSFMWHGYDLLQPAVILLLISFFFKLAAAPFHF